MTDSPLAKYFQGRATVYASTYSSSAQQTLLSPFCAFSSFAMIRTFNYTQRHLDSIDLHEKYVLDIGCGVGAYTVSLAERGANVTSLDCCGDMISLAGRRVRAAGVESQVELVHADFSEWSCEGKSYDLAVVVGVMDYIADAEQFLRRLNSVADGVIATFPARCILNSLAHARYRKRGFDGFSYRPEEVKNLLAASGFTVNSFSYLFPGSFWVHAVPVAASEKDEPWA